MTTATQPEFARLKIGGSYALTGLGLGLAVLPWEAGASSRWSRVPAVFCWLVLFIDKMTERESFGLGT